MARARNIKPGFFKNEDLSDLSPHARLLFIGLWCLADREGFLEDRPKRIKGELFPYENVEIDECLQDLHESGFILRYEVDGERFICIPKFKDHQNPHHREATSKIPKPRESKDKQGALTDQGKEQPQNSLGLSSENTCQGSDEPTKSRADSLIPDSLKLIPDSLIPDTTTTDSEEQNKSVVVIGGRDLHVFNSVINQYKHYFVYEPNHIIMNLLHSYLDDGVQMDMLAWAMREAAEKGKPWGYAKGAIEKLFSCGIRTAEQADLADKEFKQKREQNPSGKVVRLVDKLPESVQWQMQQTNNGTKLSQEAKGINDYPEMVERLQRMRSRA
ncbi:DnaD domain protein [Brevibacillus formosus]|uniref:DnaD domain protein n=1 Tax=Brevibacillus formosus TaxID=54913 RepID=UPI003F1D6C63